MSVTKWNPFGELEDVADRYSRLFGAHLPMRERLELLGKDIEWKPAADIVERDDEYLIKAELPGVDRDDIDIHLENDVLTITRRRRRRTRRIASSVSMAASREVFAFRTMWMRPGSKPKAATAY
jgi:HSP20 family molecular chaperone IbpA